MIRGARLYTDRRSRLKQTDIAELFQRVVNVFAVGVGSVLLLSCE